MDDTALQAPKKQRRHRESRESRGSARDKESRGGDEEYRRRRRERRESRSRRESGDTEDDEQERELRRERRRRRRERAGSKSSRRSRSSGRHGDGKAGDMFITGLDIDGQVDPSRDIRVLPLEEESGSGSDGEHSVIQLTYPIEMCSIKRKPTTAQTVTQKKVEARLEGLPGRLNLNPQLTNKYFGEAAREHFFDRYKWIDKQMQITQLDRHEGTPSFYFDNERLKKHERVNDYAFAPKRPEFRGELPAWAEDPELAAAAAGNMDEDIRVAKLAALFAKAALGELKEGEEEDDEEEESAESVEESDEEEEIPDSTHLYEQTLKVHQEARFNGAPLPGLDMPEDMLAAVDHAHRVGTAGGGLRVGTSNGDNRNHSLLPDADLRGPSAAAARPAKSGASVASLSSNISSLGIDSADGEEAERQWLESLGVMDGLDSALTPMKKHIGHVKGGRFSLPLRPARQASILMREQKKEQESAVKRAQKLMKLQENSKQQNHSMNVHSQVALESIKSRLSRLSNSTQHSNNPTNSFMLNALAVPNSPRTAYLVGCTKLGVLPRASLVLRKNLTKVLDLKHQGMGNQMAVLLAQSLRNLPYIQSIDLTDNNLSCDGLCAIFGAIQGISGLLSLELGHNDMGPESSLALGNYLADPKCPLVRLSLTHADVDDFECAKFVAAIQKNKCIKELNLSHNKIGEAENLNSVMPDITTGSEALADLLLDEGCELEALDLSWNKIRLDGAVSLAASLAVNKSLTQLDLSYNALGNEAGLVLGESLIENRSLRYLTLKNNGIDTCACFTICQAVIENFCLKEVSLDGNPIGEMGAKALMMIPMAVGSRVSVSAASCNISIKDDKCWFDSAFPCRSYALYLDKPFDRAVMFSLLSIVASHQTYIFSKIMYEPPLESKPPKPGCKPPPTKYGKGEPIELVQTVMTEKEAYFDDSQKQVVDGLRRLKEAASNPVLALKLFRQMDEDGGGGLDKHELKSLLSMIGLSNMTMSEVEDIILQYDVDNTGNIGMEEFKEFLRRQVTDADTKLRDMTEEIVMCPKATPNKRFVPPRCGCMRVDLVDGFVKKALFKAVSDTDRLMIHKTANSTDDVSKSIGFAVENVKLRYKEAFSLYEVMYKETRNRTKVLTTLFPCMADPIEARKLLVKVTDDDKKEQQQIKTALGYIVKPLLGAPDGYYCLDLNKELDKICLYRLMEISQASNIKRQAENQVAGVVMGDTSQHGNWTCFRNEVLNQKPTEVTAEAFTPAPKRGILEFDFCSAAKPPCTANLLANKRFLKIMNNCCLLKQEGFDTQLENMRKLKRSCDKALEGNGTTKAHVKTPAQMMEIFMLTEKFNTGITGRQAAYVKGLKAEEVNVDFMSTKLTLRGSLNDADFKDLSKASSLARQLSMKMLNPTVADAVTSGDGDRERQAKGGDDGGTTTPPGPPPAAAPSPTNSPSPLPRRAGLMISKKVAKEAEVPKHMQYLFEANDPDLYKPHLTGVGRGRNGKSRGVDTAETRTSTADSSNYSRSSTAEASAAGGRGRGRGALVVNPDSPLRGRDGNDDGDEDNNFSRHGRHHGSASGDSGDEHGDLPSVTFGSPGGGLLRSPSMKGNCHKHSSSPHRQPSIMVCRNPSIAAMNLHRTPSRKVLPGIGTVAVTPSITTAIVSPETGKITRGETPEHMVDYVPLIVEAEKETPEEREARIREEKADLRRITFKKMLFSPQVSPASKAARVVQYLEDVLSAVYITCRQMTVLLECFSQGKINKCFNAPEFGSYRVELLVAVFTRIVDVQNMHIILAVLEPAEYAAALCRIGVLNLFNPLLPEGHHVMNLGRNRDDRMFAKIFLTLSVVEPGINWVQHGFRWSLEDSDPWIPGWDCPAGWMTDIGMPGRGVLQLTYCSGDGTKKDGFDTNLDLRKALCYVCRVHELDMVTDEQRAKRAEETPVQLEGRPCAHSPGGSVCTGPPPGARYIESKIDMFRKYLATNNVKAALEFAKNGPKAAAAAGKGAKKK